MNELSSRSNCSVAECFEQSHKNVPLPFLKKHKGSYLELFTDVFAAHPMCFSNGRRKMETVGELSGEPLSGKYLLRIDRVSGNNCCCW